MHFPLQLTWKYTFYILSSMKKKNTWRRRAGIGRTSAHRLSRVLRATDGTIRAEDLCKVLGLTRSQSQEALRQWCRSGWIHRVKRGLYVPVPLEAEHAEEANEDPWLVANRHFAPCYIGGWSAAESWNLTDQIFQTIVVFTSSRVRRIEQQIGASRFLLKQIKSELLFGLSTVWREKGQVKLSDPHKTIVDLFTYPALGGGIDHCIEIFQSYLKSEYCNLDKILEYINQSSNQVAFKRLGYVAEQICPSYHRFIEICLAKRRRGYSSLDPGLKSGNHVSHWQLVVPPLLLEIECD